MPYYVGPLYETGQTTGSRGGMRRMSQTFTLSQQNSRPRCPAQGSRSGEGGVAKGNNLPLLLAFLEIRPDSDRSLDLGHQLLENVRCTPESHDVHWHRPQPPLSLTLTLK